MVERQAPEKVALNLLHKLEPLRRCRGVWNRNRTIALSEVQNDCSPYRIRFDGTATTPKREKHAQGLGIRS